MRYRHTSSVPSVERALAILELLDRSPRQWNISDISRRLGIPKSTAHTVVLTLERLGYLTQEPNSRAYRLGLKSYCLGHGTTRGLALEQIARTEMEWIARVTELTVHMAVLDGDQAVYVQKIESRDPVSFDTYIGKRTNLHCTAFGKVLLAWSRPDVLRRFLSKGCFARYTTNTITTVESLREELRNVRARRYAVDDEEEQLGIRCVAVPILDPTGIATAALGVTATLHQLPSARYERVAAALRTAAANIIPADTPLNDSVSPGHSARPAVAPSGKITRRPQPLLL
jgi:DNA-binding IclR family transcriptional regulator